MKEDIIKKHFPEGKKKVVPFRSDPALEKMQPVTYQQLLTDKPQPLKNVLEPIIPDPGFVFIFAATGVGKTMFALNLAYSIASGKDFLKYKVKQPKKVLYVDGEMKYSQMHNRFLTIVKQQGALDNPENWNLYTPDKFLPFKLPKICDPEGQEFYNKKIEELKIEVIILDNLCTLSAIDESNVEQWKIIQDWIVYLRSKDITVILIHHAGKNGEYRGSSRMVDCVDTSILLQELDDSFAESEKTNTKKLKIVYKKNRTFGGQDALPYEVTFNAGGWGFDSLEKSNKVRITEMYDNKMRPNDIAMELGLGKRYVYKILKQLRPS